MFYLEGGFSRATERNKMFFLSWKEERRARKTVKRKI